MTEPAEIFTEYEKLILHKANEAETRLKIIDRMTLKFIKPVQ